MDYVLPYKPITFFIIKKILHFEYFTDGYPLLVDKNCQVFHQPLTFWQNTTGIMIQKTELLIIYPSGFRRHWIVFRLFKVTTVCRYESKIICKPLMFLVFHIKTQ